MTLTLHFHPLSSFCHKVLIALYENGTPFLPHKVDLREETSRTAFKQLWPIGKFPVLRDEARDRTIPESSIIIKYLDHHYPGATRFIPTDPDLALRVRERDRFCDLYLNVPMQKIVTDQLRPPGLNDPHGVEDAKALVRTALDRLEAAISGAAWAVGDAFTMADCAAGPPLFYLNQFMTLRESHPNAASYLDRLMQRPSYARVLTEAEPYMRFFPNPKAARTPTP
jgi:glutathione S-transferase